MIWNARIDGLVRSVDGGFIEHRSQTSQTSVQQVVVIVRDLVSHGGKKRVRAVIDTRVVGVVVTRESYTNCHEKR